MSFARKLCRKKRISEYKGWCRRIRQDKKEKPARLNRKEFRKEYSFC